MNSMQYIFFLKRNNLESRLIHATLVSFWKLLNKLQIVVNSIHQEVRKRTQTRFIIMIYTFNQEIFRPHSSCTASVEPPADLSVSLVSHKYALFMTVRQSSLSEESESTVGVESLGESSNCLTILPINSRMAEGRIAVITVTKIFFASFCNSNLTKL